MNEEEFRRFLDAEHAKVHFELTLMRFNLLEQLLKRVSERLAAEPDNVVLRRLVEAQFEFFGRDWWKN